MPSDFADQYGWKVAPGLMAKSYAKKLIAYGLAYGGQKAARYLIDKGTGYARKGYKYVSSKMRGGRSGGKRNETTSQRDVTTRFVQRSRNTRGFRRFRSKVRAALQADQPRLIYQAYLKGGAIGGTGVTSKFGMYLADLNTTAQGDIWNIFKDAYGLATSADAVDKKILLNSGVLDLQMRNADGTSHMYFDVYELNARVNWADTNTVNSQFDGLFSEMSDIGVTASDLPNVTPFQVPNFLRKYKVRRTKTYYVEPNKCVSIQVRRRYNRMINGRELGDAPIRGKLTTAILVIARGTPTNSATTTGLNAVSYSWSAQMTYHYQEVSTAQTTDTIGQTK